jgi:cobalt-zinc-cadmium efflux system protein
LGVVVAGLVVMYTGWTWLDPAVSLVIVVIIVAGTWSLTKESLQMVLAGVPASVDATGVTAFLAAQPGVTEVHDVHIWAMSTTETALTAHLVMPDGYPGDAAIDDIVGHLREDFAIHHCTLQVELGTTKHSSCCLHDDHGHDHGHDHDHDHDHDHHHHGSHSHAH